MLTIINLYILITRRFFHVELKDGRKMNSPVICRDFQGEGQTNANNTCPFQRR